MLFLQLFVIFLTCHKGKAATDSPTTYEADSIDACQKRVIEECSEHSKGLLKAIESGSGRRLKEECDSLQATIDCIAVPRCAGNLMQAFRYIVLTTAKSLQKIKKTSTSCSKLNVSMLKRYVKGLSIACVEKKNIKDTCDRNCVCLNGDLVTCARVRKEFTKMSLEERTRFIKAFKLVSTDPRYKDDYRKLTTMYSNIPKDIINHDTSVFLPWYRGYLLELENMLRQIDCRITIPYWDWSKDAAHWNRDSEIEDVWNSGPSGLGGNGILPDMCVMDGPFKEGEFSIPWYAKGGCLKRDFSQSCNLPNTEYVNALQHQEFLTFEKSTREVIHSSFQECVGGSMDSTLTSTYTPEFWLHHAFIDKVWMKWKGKGSSDLEYYRHLTFKLPGFDKFPWEYAIGTVLPGDVSVQYEE